MELDQSLNGFTSLFFFFLFTVIHHDSPCASSLRKFSENEHAEGAKRFIKFHPLCDAFSNSWPRPATSYRSEFIAESRTKATLAFTTFSAIKEASN